MVPQQRDFRLMRHEQSQLQAHEQQQRLQLHQLLTAQAAKQARKEERKRRWEEEDSACGGDSQEMLQREYSTAVEEAAVWGKLTRLKEHVVETMGTKKQQQPQQQQQDENQQEHHQIIINQQRENRGPSGQSSLLWKPKTLLEIQEGTRNHFLDIVRDAAAVGAITRLPEKIVCNYEEEEEEVEDEYEDYDEEEQEHSLERGSRNKHKDCNKKLTLQQLHQRVGLCKVEQVILMRKDQEKRQRQSSSSPSSSPRRSPGNHQSGKITMHSRLDQVVLPLEPPPCFIKKTQSTATATAATTTATATTTAATTTSTTLNGLRLDIPSQVALKAWERQRRLDRPHVIPQVRENCRCKWCQTASPYQTYAYQKVQKQKQKQHQAFLKPVTEEVPGHEDYQEEKKEYEQEQEQEYCERYHQAQDTTTTCTSPKQQQKNNKQQAKLTLHDLHNARSQRVAIPPAAVVSPSPSSSSRSPPSPSSPSSPGTAAAPGNHTPKVKHDYDDDHDQHEYDDDDDDDDDDEEYELEYEELEDEDSVAVVVQLQEDPEEEVIEEEQDEAVVHVVQKQQNEKEKVLLVEKQESPQQQQDNKTQENVDGDKDDNGDDDEYTEVTVYTEEQNEVFPEITLYQQNLQRRPSDVTMDPTLLLMTQSGCSTTSSNNILEQHVQSTTPPKKRGPQSKATRSTTRSSTTNSSSWSFDSFACDYPEHSQKPLFSNSQQNRQQHHRAYHPSGYHHEAPSNFHHHKQQQQQQPQRQQQQQRREQQHERQNFPSQQAPFQPFQAFPQQQQQKQQKQKQPPQQFKQQSQQKQPPQKKQQQKHQQHENYSSRLPQVLFPDDEVEDFDLQKLFPPLVTMPPQRRPQQQRQPQQQQLVQSRQRQPHWPTNTLFEEESFSRESSFKNGGRSTGKKVVSAPSSPSAHSKRNSTPKNKVSSSTTTKMTTASTAFKKNHCNTINSPLSSSKGTRSTAPLSTRASSCRDIMMSSTWTNKHSAVGSTAPREKQQQQQQSRSRPQHQKQQQPREQQDRERERKLEHGEPQSRRKVRDRPNIDFIVVLEDYYKTHRDDSDDVSMLSMPDYFDNTMEQAILDKMFQQSSSSPVQRPRPHPLKPKQQKQAPFCSLSRLLSKLKAK